MPVFICFSAKLASLLVRGLSRSYVKDSEIGVGLYCFKKSTIICLIEVSFKMAIIVNCV